MMSCPPRSTLFPYTTLFRSCQVEIPAGVTEAQRRLLQEEELRRKSNFYCLVAKGKETQGKLLDRKSTRLNSSHGYISYAVFCLKKKKHKTPPARGLPFLDPQ